MTVERRIAVVVVALLMVAGCSGGGASDAASATQRLVETTSISQDASFVTSRAKLPNLERRVYTIPAGVDPRTMIVTPPPGFTISYDAKPGDDTRGTREGLLDVRTYGGPNPTDPKLGCYVAVQTVTDPAKFDMMPSSLNGRAVMVVDYSC